MADVVVLGSLNMDLVVRTRQMPRPGETAPGYGFLTVPGGKGANQAAAAARLGVSVEMLGCVGGDAFGEAILANLRAQGVGVAHIRRDQATPSGIAMIVVDDRGENAIVVAPGANGQVSLADVQAARGLLAEARYLVMQFEIPLPVVREAISLAARLGVRVILNPAPAYRVEPAFLAGVYCLVVNETEVELLTGVAVRGMDGVVQAGQALRALGVPVAIVTLGAQGAYLSCGEGEVHAPARSVRVVDTTAAGDAFIGGLAAALLREMPLPEAVRYATCAGTLATTVLGAQTSLPSAVQVDAFYREGQP
jgi:ribokinase